jgi:hypothetical protein
MMFVVGNLPGLIRNESLLLVSWGCSLVVENLPSLDSILNNVKNKQKIRPVCDIAGPSLILLSLLFCGPKDMYLKGYQEDEGGG